MNQKERKARDKFKDKSLGRIKVCLIENMLGDGTPDSICINRNGAVFWIEFKADDWPKRPTTLPLKRSFEKGQIPFLKEWQDWHGKSFVLICFDGEFYLLNPNAKKDLREATKEELIGDVIQMGLENIVKFLESIEE